MSETEKRKRRSCFSGYRPEKLRLAEDAVFTILGNAIDAAIANGYVTFISGMARGVDIWAAEIVLERKMSNPDLRLICALPHPDFERNWRDSWQQRYREILARADLVKTICPAFSIASYQCRNEWMVDHSAQVIAIYNGATGGTRNTIEYAERQGIHVEVHRA